MAQTAPAEKPSAKKADEPFAITDNSFLVEEAFNQEAGIFQNIVGATFVHSLWAFNFTQEWPVTSQPHQLSFTLSALDNGTGSGVGDTLVNYRYQALTEGPGRPAFSPRASLILPTGDVPRLRGTDRRVCRSTFRSASRPATGTGTGTVASRGCREPSCPRRILPTTTAWI